MQRPGGLCFKTLQKSNSKQFYFLLLYWISQMVYFQLSKINALYVLTFHPQNRESSFFVIWSVVCAPNKILIVPLL